MQIKASSNKSLFQKNYQTIVEIEENFPSPLPSVGPLFCDFFNKTDLPLNAIISLAEEHEVKNLRGKQRYSSSSNEEELLFLSGSAVEIAEEGQVEEKLDFTCKINSSFVRSDGKRDIVYKLQSDIPNTILNPVPGLYFQQIFNLLPISWKQLRFGIEMFKATFFGSMVGSAPLIVKRLYIDMTLERIKIFIEDSSRKKVRIPLGEEGVIAALDSTFAELLNQKENISDSVVKQLDCTND